MPTRVSNGDIFFLKGKRIMKTKHTNKAIERLCRVIALFLVVVLIFGAVVIAEGPAYSHSAGWGLGGHTTEPALSLPELENANEEPEEGIDVCMMWANHTEIVRSYMSNANIAAFGQLPNAGGNTGAQWVLCGSGTLVVQPGAIDWNMGTESPWHVYRDDIQKIIFDFDEPVLVGPRLRSLFNGLANVHTIVGLEYFDTSNVNSMNSTFNGASSLVDIGDLSGWDVGNVITMHAMFRGTSSLESLNLSGWSTGNVTSMSEMFRDASSLANLELSGWDTGNVTTMHSMFLGISNLAELDLSAWNTGNVTIMAFMFQGATSLEHLDLSGWDVGRVTTMDAMFRNAASLISIGDVSKWDTGSVVNMSRVFRDARSIEHLDLSGWDTSAATDMHWMFHSANSLESLNLSGWSVNNVTDMSHMFIGATSLQRLVLGEEFEFIPTAALPNIPVVGTFTGNWVNIDNGTVRSSAALMADTDLLGTWVWQRAFDVTYMVAGSAPASFSPEIPGVASYMLGETGIAVAQALASADTTDGTQLGTWTFGGWATDDVAVENGAFTMPGNNVEFRGVWEFTPAPPSEHVVTYTVIGNAPASFTPALSTLGGSYEDGVTITVAANLTTASNLYVDGITLGVWTFVGWSRSGAFVMPDYDVTITGSWAFAPNDSFDVTYTVIGDAPENFSPAIPGLSSYQQGITDIIVAEGLTSTDTTDGMQVGTWIFSGWATEDATVEDGMFAMPANHVLFTGAWIFTPSSDSGAGDTNTGGGVVSSPSTTGNVVQGTGGGQSVSDIISAPRSEHHAFIIGFGDGTVRPNLFITRAQVATIFFRLMPDDARQQYWIQLSPFADVNIDYWFSNAVSTGYNAGIVVGMPDGSFQPNREITRAELAAAAVRFMNFEQTAGQSRFADANGHWAEGYINTAAAMGWITGYADGTFRPDASITRAETAALINRMLNRLPETADDLLEGMIKWPDNADILAWYYLYIQEATNSHTYHRNPDNIYETWEALIPNRPWYRLEMPTSQPGDLFR